MKNDLSSLTDAVATLSVGRRAIGEQAVAILQRLEHVRDELAGQSLVTTSRRSQAPRLNPLLRVEIILTREFSRLSKQANLERLVSVADREARR